MRIGFNHFSKDAISYRQVAAAYQALALATVKDTSLMLRSMSPADVCHHYGIRRGETTCASSRPSLALAAEARPPVL